MERGAMRVLETRVGLSVGSGLTTAAVGSISAVGSAAAGAAAEFERTKIASEPNTTIARRRIFFIKLVIGTPTYSHARPVWIYFKVIGAPPRLLTIEAYPACVKI